MSIYNEYLLLQSAQRRLRKRWAKKAAVVFGQLLPNTREIILRSIVVKKKGEGTGSTIMREIAALADTYRWSVVLFPSDELGTPLPVLERFYKSVGFVPSQADEDSPDYGAFVYYPKKA